MQHSIINIFYRKFNNVKPGFYTQVDGALKQRMGFSLAMKLGLM